MASEYPARIFDALPDTIDFRDIMYEAALIEVPGASDLDSFRAIGLPVLDQGQEGACTGFGLATVVNYLLAKRGKEKLADEASAAMLYVMAKRYDEWPGEDYEGSSARGAMKGWHKHGVCAARLWEDSKSDWEIDAQRAADALNRPLGAYYRVNHLDLVAMHAAISEVGILYATASVHQGWMEVKSGDDQIVYSQDVVGGHAFAIVGYDRQGFWIQNSWGPEWGKGGLARLSYADWLENGTDVWVAALGAPVTLDELSATAALRSAAPQSYATYVYAQLRPHIITCMNDGQLDPKGEFGLTSAGLADLIGNRIPDHMSGWGRRRLMLYAHGGLVPQSAAVQHVANSRQLALDAQVYPLSFVWRSDIWSTIRNLLRDAIGQRQQEGWLDGAKDFMFDRLDDTLEPIASTFGGKALWDEMKENATRATITKGGAARQVAELLAPQVASGTIDEVHLAGHSAGAIFMAPLAGLLSELGVKIGSVSLWAPACTIELFEQAYLPLVNAGAIQAFDLYTLDDATERNDNCAGIYHKSLLYLVSNAFEEQPKIRPRQNGMPLLGRERDVAVHLPRTGGGSFWSGPGRNWYVAPGSPNSKATHHGDFDDDELTLRSTLARISGQAPASVGAVGTASTRAVVRQRQSVELALAHRLH
jgi:hypothetical protein